MTWVDLVMGRYCWPGSNIDFTSMKRLYDQECSYYISTEGLKWREEGHFQSLGLAQFLGSTRLKYLQVKHEFLFQSGRWDVSL